MFARKSFIYRFYAESSSKSFIYRIYVSAPGVGGFPLRLQLAQFARARAMSAPKLCYSKSIFCYS
jgi:hypothetical protein